VGHPDYTGLLGIKISGNLLIAFLGLSRISGERVILINPNTPQRRE
jgi:hypothetical protein